MHAGRPSLPSAVRARRHQLGSVPRRVRGMYPWYAAAGLAIAAAASWAAAAWVHTVLVAAVCGMIGLSGGLLGWHLVRHRLQPHVRTQVAVASLAGCCWLVTVTLTGPSWSAIAALGIGTAGFSLRWWRFLRRREAHAAAAPEDAWQHVERDWRSYVGCAGGQLPNSELDDRRRTGRAHSWTLQLDRGRQDLNSVLHALTKIASGLNIPTDQLVVEEHPSRRPSQVLFKVVHRSPVTENAYFDRPRFHDGIAEIGPYIDGDGEATWRIYRDQSMFGGVVIGSSGSGKSRIMENIACSAASSPLDAPTVEWFIDPQDGASSPALQTYADLYTGLDRAEEVLDAVERIAYWRGKENAAQGRTGFRVCRCSCDDQVAAMTSGDHRSECRYRPGLLIFIDEAHLVFQHTRIAVRWGNLGRMIRKLGIAVIALSQYPGQETFGGYEPLRQALVMGNAAVLNVDSNIAGALVPGIEVDPRNLPRLPGYAYTVRKEAFGRTAPFRNRLMVNDDGDPDATRWLAGHPRLKLDPLAANAAGAFYANRTTDVDQLRTLMTMEVDAMRRGDLTQPEPDQPTPPAVLLPDPHIEVPPLPPELQRSPSPATLGPDPAAN